MSLVLNMSNGVVKQVSETRVSQGVYMGTEEEVATWPGERREAGMQRATVQSVMLREWEDQVATGPWPETTKGPGTHVCSSPQEPLGILPLAVMSCGADSTGPCLLQAGLCSLFGCTICLFLTKAPDTQALSRKVVGALGKRAEQLPSVSKKCYWFRGLFPPEQPSNSKC